MLAALALAGLSEVSAKTNGAKSSAAKHASAALDARGFEAWRSRFVAKLIASNRIDPSDAHRILDAIAYDGEVVTTLGKLTDFQPPMRDYLAQRVSPERLAKGRELMTAHADLLAALEARYHVDGTAILAVWCMETRFGEAELKYDAVRSLATLAYAGPRKSFFESQLTTLIGLIARGAIRFDHPKASIDGGLGQAQFMPDAFAHYAVDWDHDGVADIWTSMPDALASIASYLSDAGWRHGGPYFVRAAGRVKPGDAKKKQTLADWAKAGVAPAEGSFDASLLARVFQPDTPKGGWLLAFTDFDAFKRYNGASRYAVSASLLADGFAGAPVPDPPWPAPANELSIADIALLQAGLARSGFDPGVSDGRYGERTWRAMNAFLKAHGAKPADYPTPSVLRMVESAAPERAAPERATSESAAPESATPESATPGRLPPP